MKCPTCNAVTRILETRQTNPGVLRRRECFNLHRFSTVEVVASVGRGNVTPDVVVLQAHGVQSVTMRARRAKAALLTGAKG